MSKSRVFVLMNSRNRHFDPAEEYGDLEYVLKTTDELYPDNDRLKSDVVASKIEDALSDFNPKRDYVLLTGDPAALALLGSVMQRICGNGRKVRLLKWDNVDKQYFVVELNT